MNRVLKEHPTISTISELLGFIIYSPKLNSVMWMKYRKGMMTASSFHRISKLKVSTDPDKLIRFLMEGSSFVIVPAPFLWGRKKEIPRKWVFKTHKAEYGHLDLIEQGLTIDQSYFYLGASPDGLCNCKKYGQFLIEIKCPSTKRNISPKHAAKVHCYEDQNKNLQLDPKSAWYYQIQGQLGICELDLCKLVVYTTKGIIVVDVPFDQLFWKNLGEKLNKFYLESLGVSTLQSLKSCNSIYRWHLETYLNSLFKSFKNIYLWQSYIPMYYTPPPPF